MDLLRVWWLDYMVTSCLTFWEIVQSFSKVVIPFCNPMGSIWGFHFFTSNLVNVKWYLFVVLICSSVMINDIEYLSCACWPFFFGEVNVRILCPFKNYSSFYCCQWSHNKDSCCWWINSIWYQVMANFSCVLVIDF